MLSEIMMPHCVRLLCLVSILCLVPDRVSALQEGSGDSEVHLGIPPKDLWWTGEGYASVDFSDLGISGRISYFTKRKEISILWRHKESGAAKQQILSCSYWPTAVQGIDDNALIVGGKRRHRGRTVIEKWVLVPPLVRAVSSAGGASSGIVLEPESPSSILNLYDDAVVGKDMVAQVLPVLGAEDRMLVQFWDSHQVYECGHDSEPEGDPVLTLVAGPSPPAPLVAPSLANAFTESWSGRHVDHGFVYVFHDEHRRKDGEDLLVLLDSDENGTLETVIVPTADQWVSMGFADTSNYID